jgi:hypothetical protein
MDVCDSGNFRLTKNQGVSSFVVYREGWQYVLQIVGYFSLNQQK